MNFPWPRGKKLLLPTQNSMQVLSVLLPEAEHTVLTNMNGTAKSPIKYTFLQRLSVIETVVNMSVCSISFVLNKPDILDFT